MAMTLPLAESVSFWANWTLIGALAVGVLATLAIVVSANIKEEHWSAERDAAGERISANEAETERAKESAAKAEERAAKAELALAQYRAGRTLSAEQRATLVTALEAAPKGRVIVKPNFLDGEATTFANQISQAFGEAGFAGVGDAPLEIVSYNRAGLFLAYRSVNSPPPHLAPVLGAFQKAGVPIEPGQGNWVPDDNTVVIIVSGKP
ncbi:MAG: hypothetical protein Q7T08_12055 [Devosia sp.]|nr:hypothetical protein [Devosia sp.]